MPFLSPKKNILICVLWYMAMPSLANELEEVQTLPPNEKVFYYQEKHHVEHLFNQFLKKKYPNIDQDEAELFRLHAQASWRAFRHVVAVWNKQHPPLDSNGSWSAEKDGDFNSGPFWRYSNLLNQLPSSFGVSEMESLLKQKKLTRFQSTVLIKNNGQQLSDKVRMDACLALLEDKTKYNDLVLLDVNNNLAPMTDPVPYRICDNVSLSIEKIYHPRYGDLKYGVDYADPEFFCEIPAANRKNFQLLVDRRIELLKAWGVQYQKRIALRKQLRDLLTHHAEAGLTVAQFSASLDLWQSLAGSSDSDKAQDEVFPVLVEVFLANARKQGKGGPHVPAIQQELFSRLGAFLQGVNQHWTDHEPIIIRPLNAGERADFAKALAWLREEVTLLKSKTKKNRNPNDFFTHTGRINTLLSVVEAAAQKLPEVLPSQQS